MKFHIRVGKNDRFATSKTSHTEFYFLTKQKLYNSNKPYYGDCRAFHAASYGIFGFFNNMYLEIKI